MGSKTSIATWIKKNVTDDLSGKKKLVKEPTA